VDGWGGRCGQGLPFADLLAVHQEPEPKRHERARLLAELRGGPMANGSWPRHTVGAAGTFGPHCPSEVEFEPEVEDSGRRVARR